MFTKQTPRDFHTLCLPCLAVVTGLALGCISTPSQAAENLRDALNQALVRASDNFTSGTMEATGDTSSRRWLGGLPTLSMSYLGSDQTYGTDETEVSLSFPIKSPLQRNSDARLNTVDPKLDAATQRYRAWYLSGTLRELYARQRRAQAVLPAAVATSTLLTELESQLKARLSAGSAERFELLAVQRQRLDAGSKLARLRAEITGVARLYTSLTGDATLPKDSGDTAQIPEQPLYAQHPRLLLLDLNRDQQLASLRASSSSATPWNIALVGRELAIPNFTERQLGVAIDVPLSFGAKPSTAVRSSERALTRAYQMQRDEALIQLHGEWTRLQTEREQLLSRKALLVNLVDAQAVGAMIEQTRNSLELPIELRLQRMQALLDTQAEPDLVAAQIDANSAALRQLAGLGL